MFHNFNTLQKFYQVGSLAALHLGKRGHNVSVYEYREGEFQLKMHQLKLLSFSQTLEQLNLLSVEA